MSQYPKRLIEVDLPIKRISAHARREKSIRHGHISTLHIWWARRPLASCRAVICASLWPDPADSLCPQSFREKAAGLVNAFAIQVNSPSQTRLKESCSPESLGRWLALAKTEGRIDPTNPAHLNLLRYALLDFIADFANWDNSTVKEYLETSRALTQSAHEALGGAPGTRPLVVDPFAGGGSIPLEALRVGADAFASDLNPVAVLLNKVVLEYIPKYGQRLADEVRKWGQWMKEQAERELAEFYPKDPDGATPIAYLWARTITCEGPGCGAEVPLMRSLWLAKKASRSVALRMVPTPRAKRVDFEIVENARVRDVAEGTVRRGSATCPCCGYTTPVASVRRQLKERRGGAADARLFVVVTTRPGQQGRFYRLPGQDDLAAVTNSAAELERRKAARSGSLSLVPDEPTTQYHTFVNRGPIYGMTTWADYFTPRQALALTTLARLVRDAGTGLAAEDENGLPDAVQVGLALCVDKIADLANSLCPWEPVAECPRHLFARQAIPFTWDFSEGVVTGESSGSLSIIVDRFAHVMAEIGSAWDETSPQQASATAHPLPDDVAQAFITDPPYYYSVQYADLSDFFYVWLRRTLEGRFPSLLSTPLTPKDDEIIVQSPGHEFATEGKNNAFYESHMRTAMAEGRRLLAPGGIGLVVFAHKSTSGWETQLQAMVNAGWTITGSWPIDTEMSTRMLAQNRAVLASSIHLVCRPRENPDGSVSNGDIGDWRDVLQELPRRIHQWMPRLAENGVVGADAIFACLGPALEIFSRYSRVEKASGEQVTLKEYLEQVWAAVAREAMTMIFEGGDATGFEEDSRLTAMWLWTLSAGANGAVSEEANGEEEAEDSEEGGASGKGPRVVGFTLEYDAARKIAQGLGAHLERLPSVVQIKGDKARLLPVAERARHLFGRAERQAPTRRRPKATQLALFKGPDETEDDQGALDYDNVPKLGETVLDRLHQSMVLFASGRGAALQRFLVEDGVGQDQRFWRLAQALSALYPAHTEEKRWVDGVMARKRGLGL
jgi:adenine-specific DNA methylase